MLLLPQIGSDNRLFDWLSELFRWWPDEDLSSCCGISPVNRSGMKQFWRLLWFKELLTLSACDEERPIFGMDLMRRDIFFEALVVVVWKRAPALPPVATPSAVKQLPMIDTSFWWSRCYSSRLLDSCLKSITLKSGRRQLKLMTRLIGRAQSTGVMMVSKGVRPGDELWLGYRREDLSIGWLNFDSVRRLSDWYVAGDIYGKWVLCKWDGLAAIR